MVTRQEACERILARFTPELGAISSCELDSRGRYWVIFANTRAWVVYGDGGRCLVGVSAYLIEVSTGELTVLGSGSDWRTYLEDLYDREETGGAYRVLISDHEVNDKRAIIRLHQRLGCSLGDARWLLSEANRSWFTGTRRVLTDAQAMFASLDMRTHLEVRDDPQQAVELLGPVWAPGDLWSCLRERLGARAPRGT